MDLQNSYLDVLDTFVAVPLRASAALTSRIADIHLAMEISGQKVVIDMPMMATFPKHGLGQPIANLRPYKLEIQGALDALLGEH